LFGTGRLAGCTPLYNVPHVTDTLHLSLDSPGMTDKGEMLDDKLDAGGGTQGCHTGLPDTHS
jgi:hypothetical protein